MFSEETLKKSRELKREWEAKTTRKYREIEPAQTLSGLPINPVYTPDDIAHIDFQEIGIPGAYPYTRGIHGSIPAGPLQYGRLEQQNDGLGWQLLRQPRTFCAGQLAAG